VIEHDRRAEAHLASRFDQTSPRLGINLIEKQKLNRPVVGKTPGRQNAGIIEHEQLARPNEPGEIGKSPVVDCSCASIEHQHARILPPRQRPLRD
jgi:hypothetical protein